MVDSAYKAARHLMTRVGYDGDNLVTAYSNPAIGRALLVEWVGARIGDQNLTQAGAQYAQNVYDLFTAENFNTLGEYNVPSTSMPLPASHCAHLCYSVLRDRCLWPMPVDSTRPVRLEATRIRLIHPQGVVEGYSTALQLVSCMTLDFYLPLTLEVSSRTWLDHTIVCTTEIC